MVNQVKHGKPVARLVPELSADKGKIDDVISRLKSARKGVRLDGLSWQELRDEGRKSDRQLADRILKDMETSRFLAPSSMPGKI